jgi:hypothetical protein
MRRTAVRRGSPATDLAALHDALGCATTAVVQAWRGDEGSTSLSLAEAHSAAEEAFGRGSPGTDALAVVFDAIAQASRISRRPAAGRNPAAGR